MFSRTRAFEVGLSVSPENTQEGRRDSRELRQPACQLAGKLVLHLSSFDRPTKLQHSCQASTQHPSPPHKYKLPLHNNRSTSLHGYQVPAHPPQFSCMPNPQVRGGKQVLPHSEARHKTPSPAYIPLYAYNYANDKTRNVLSGSAPPVCAEGSFSASNLEEEQTALFIPELQLHGKSAREQTDLLALPTTARMKRTLRIPCSISSNSCNVISNHYKLRAVHILTKLHNSSSPNGLREFPEKTPDPELQCKPQVAPGSSCLYSRLVAWWAPVGEHLRKRVEQVLNLPVLPRTFMATAGALALCNTQGLLGLHQLPLERRLDSHLQLRYLRHPLLAGLRAFPLGCSLGLSCLRELPLERCLDSRLHLQLGYLGRPLFTGLSPHFPSWPQPRPFLRPPLAC